MLAAVNFFMNYFQQENESVKGQFDLDEVLAFTLKHDVQIIRGEDYSYQSYIDKKFYGTSLTPIHALWFGIQSYKLHEGR